MKTCTSCGASLVTPEEMNAHRDCTRDIPPPPDLQARIRWERAQKEKQLKLAELARQRRNKRGAEETNRLRKSTTTGLAERFDRFRRKHPDLSAKDTLPAFRGSLPEDVRRLLPLGDAALGRRIRRGRAYRREEK